MIYETEADWRAAEHKRVLVFGMSGLGKTHIANFLRKLFAFDFALIDVVEREAAFFGQSIDDHGLGLGGHFGLDLGILEHGLHDQVAAV